MNKKVVWYINYFFDEFKDRGVKSALRKTYYFLVKKICLMLGRAKGNYIVCSKDLKISSSSNVYKGKKKSLLVSVIVPNYNHEAFLRERLESIYNQTYQNFEVFLLDDCSTDGSRSILEEYKAKYPDKTTLVFNEKNSGGPFFQWKKGLALATGDLVWIAESDDSCDINFLESHIRSFFDTAVLLSFSPSDFIINGKKKESSESILCDIMSPSLFKTDFVMSSAHFVNNFLGKRNVIINVSSCLIRNMSFDLFDESGWVNFELCGDWIFYLNVIAGGRVSFNRRARNYYRVHANSTSKTVQRKLLYYTEHEKVACEIARLYNVDKRTLYIHYLLLRNRFESEYGNLYSFSDYYDINKIKSVSSERKINILMCVYALIAGGGEVFPINMANSLRKKGFPVTLYVFDPTKEDENICQKILKGIPIVRQVSNDARAILDEFNVDIVHSHFSAVDDFFAHERLSRNDFRLVVTQHGMYEMMNNFSKDILERLYGVDKWVYIVEKNIKFFVEESFYDENRFIKIYNAVDQGRFEKLSRSFCGIPENAFVFCLVSRAIPEKGWREAIEAVTLARSLCMEDIHLLLVGNGPMYDKLKDDSESFVHFAGFQPQAKTFFAMSDVALLPSTFKGESVPLSILEAYSVGKPVLATNLGEIPYMLNHQGRKAGSLIDLDENGCISIEVMAKEMVRMATDMVYYEELRSNVLFVSKKFDFEKMISQYIEVYNDALVN